MNLVHLLHFEVRSQKTRVKRSKRKTPWTSFLIFSQALAGVSPPRPPPLANLAPPECRKCIPVSLSGTSGLLRVFAKQPTLLDEQ